MTLVLLGGGPWDGQTRDLPAAILDRPHASLGVFGDRPDNGDPSPMLGRYPLRAAAEQGTAHWAPEPAR